VSQNWTIRPVNRQGGFVIKNVSGAVALEVVLTISGSVTGGPFGTDPEKWRRTEPRVEPDGELQDVFGHPWSTDIAMLHIRWKDEHGRDHSESREIPFP
jgi:hypothetical protein